MSGVYDGLTETDTETATLLLGAMSHNARLMLIYSSIGMLYLYDKAWSGSLTGAYGGSGSIVPTDDAFTLDYIFSNGNVIGGVLSGDTLEFAVSDSNGNELYSCKLSYDNGVWYSESVEHGCGSYMELDGNIRFVMTDSVPLQEFGIGCGIDSLYGLAEFCLVITDGAASLEAFGGSN